MNKAHWPHNCDKKLIIGDPTCSVGIATLWTMKNDIADKLDSNKYCVVGNFYDSVNGLEPLIRNCLSNPYIRHIFIVGADKSGSKKTLINFFTKGITDGFVTETNIKIPIDIPLKYLEILISNITLIDLTNEFDDIDCMIKSINNEITKLEQSTHTDIHGNIINKLYYNSSYIEPITFVKTVEIINTFPSKQVYTISDSHIGPAWLKILNTINSYGVDINDIRECLLIITSITEEDPYNPIIHKYMNVTKTELDLYYETFTQNKIPKNTAYTYGSRFRNKPDQIQIIIDKLKHDINSKRCIAVTWNNDVCDDINNENPPCVVSLQIKVQNNTAHATAYIRSNDMYRAWIKNAFGLRMIQKMIADAVGLEMGVLTVISCSAHIYEENLIDMKKTLSDFYGSTQCFYDERGYYVITVEDECICVSHFSPNSKLLKTYKNPLARIINDEINVSEHTDDCYHSSYLGEELMKAEICIKLGKTYEQDAEFVK